MSKNALKMAAIGLALAASSTWAPIGTTAAAQKPVVAPTVTRTVMLQADLPAMPGYAVAMVRVELPAGSREGRHQHPGTLVAFVREGALTLDYEGKPTVTYTVGQTFTVEPGKLHEGMNKGNVTTHLVASFVFPKDKPMTIQVP